MVINGSPYETDKLDERLQLALARVGESGLPLIYLNQVCGQDELVFDGGSFVIDRDFSLKAQLPHFEEALVVTEWREGGEGWAPLEGEKSRPCEGLEAIYRALVLGLRDYVNKNRFPGVILGLSGGIDSALERRRGGRRPGRGAGALRHDALALYQRREPGRRGRGGRPARHPAGRGSRSGPRCSPSRPCWSPWSTAGRPTSPIPRGFEQGGHGGEHPVPRPRALTLMALSNRLGHMVLSTGNKSEMSVGYATLYGDMCGGYNVLKDVYKLTVFELARWRNQVHPAGVLGPAGRVIAERVITKPPTAELKPDQKDDDSLPPYTVLDDILEALIEREETVEQIAARGHPRATVERVWRLLDLAEYKRRQAPPGVKITRRNLSRDRRYPITNAFKGPQ